MLAIDSPPDEKARKKIIGKLKILNTRNYFWIPQDTA
jgi:hypothetical protein